MDYKLMAVDIDGTLINSEGKLTNKTRDAIKVAVSKGLIFIIASGRPVQGIEYINEILNIDVPFITYNGAMVVMGKSKKVLYEKRLFDSDAKEIIELGKKFNTTIIVWSENKLYVSEMNEKVEKYKEITKGEPILFTDIDKLVNKGVTKVLWYDDEETIEYYQSIMGNLVSGNVNFHTSRPMFLEFVDKQASKAIAMEKLGEYFGIKQCEMIAIGDGFNDLSMIEYAGLGVAMGNSKDEIKKRADYVTLTNDEDGVAEVIYKFVLECK